MPIEVGEGSRVVLLHGLGGKAVDWQPVVDELDHNNIQLVALDLLGFGSSPKPEWSDFDVDDHAKSVAITIKKTLKTPVVLVGHSMGAIIATRVARTYPKLVKHLILYEIPVYANHSSARLGDPRNKAYRSLFTVAANNPKHTMRLIRLIGKVASEISAIHLDETTWPPFEKSLRNTVMQDTVYDDISQLSIPIDLIFGKYDFLVMKRTFKRIYKNTDNINFHKVNETHKITKRTGRVLSSIIEQAAE